MTFVKLGIFGWVGIPTDEQNKHRILKYLPLFAQDERKSNGLERHEYIFTEVSFLSETMPFYNF